jgi:hypothetical protein
MTFWEAVGGIGMGIDNATVTAIAWRLEGGTIRIGLCIPTLEP